MEFALDLADLKQYSEARRLLKNALSRMKKTLVGSHSETLTVGYCLAVAHLFICECKQTMTLVKGILSTLETPGVACPTHLLVEAQTLMAGALACQGQYKQAEATMERIIKECALKPGGMAGFAEAKDNVVGMLRELGKREGADVMSAVKLYLPDKKSSASESSLSKGSIVPNVRYSVQVASKYRKVFSSAR